MFDKLSTHGVHSSEERHRREMAGFPPSRAAQKASEFYSSVMVNKNQWILGADTPLSSCKVSGSLRLGRDRKSCLEYWKLPLYHWYHKEFMASVKCSCAVTLELCPNATKLEVTELFLAL